MQELLKYRDGKICIDGKGNSNEIWRIWISDKELAESEFSIGHTFSAMITEEDHKIELTPGGDRIVSKKKQGDKLIPLIDIKNIRIKHALEGCDHTTIEIYRDRIVITGHKKTGAQKVAEYEQEETVRRTTSFSFFVSDAPAVDAGFESKGFLKVGDESVKYSVSIECFDPGFLPKADTWFVNLTDCSQDETWFNLLQLIRIYNGVESFKRPYVLAMNTAVDLQPITSFLVSEGFIRTGNIFSALGTVVDQGRNIYQTVFTHLETGFSAISKKLSIPMVSFYCGCLSDLAFKEEGFIHIRSYDLNQEIADQIEDKDFSNPEPSYRCNIGDNFEGADLGQLPIDEIPDAPFYFFSTPCQGFSAANRRTGVLSNPKNYHMWRSVEIIKTKKPMIFAMEQVPQVLTVGGGIFLEEMQEALGEIYHITWQVIDAANTGSPQHRKRAVIVGSRLKNINIPEPHLERFMTVNEAFAGILEDLFNQGDISNNKEESITRMKCVPQGGNWRDIPLELRNPGMGANTQSYFYHRLDPDQPSRTIVNVKKAMFIHPWENRGLTVREVARLMDVPDAFEFKGSLSQMQQQLANGIPLNLVRYLAGIVREHYTEAVLDRNGVKAC